MEFPHHAIDFTPLKEERDIHVWNEAYETVESYFFALGLHNRLILNRCIYEVLRRSAVLLEKTSLPYTPTEVAMNEAMKLVGDWFERVLDLKLPEYRLSARGRLALFLGNMEHRWQEYFLAEPPWPPGFVEAMRQSYLTAGPAFQEQTMTPQSIELNALVSGASGVWFGLDRLPNIKLLVNTVIVLLLLFLIFSLIYY